MLRTTLTLICIKPFLLQHTLWAEFIDYCCKSPLYNFYFKQFFHSLVNCLLYLIWLSYFCWERRALSIITILHTLLYYFSALFFSSLVLRMRFHVCVVTGCVYVIVARKIYCLLLDAIWSITSWRNNTQQWSVVRSCMHVYGVRCVRFLNFVCAT